MKNKSALHKIFIPGFMLFTLAVHSDLLRAASTEHSRSSQSASEEGIKKSTKDTNSASRFAKALVFGLGCEDFKMIVPAVVDDLKRALASGVTHTHLENIVFDYSDDRTQNHYNAIYEFLSSRVMDIATLIEDNPNIDLNSQIFKDRVRAINQEALGRGLRCRLSESTKAKIFGTLSSNEVTDNTSAQTQETRPIVMPLASTENTSLKVNNLDVTLQGLRSDFLKGSVPQPLEALTASSQNPTEGTSSPLQDTAAISHSNVPQLNPAPASTQITMDTGSGSSTSQRIFLNTTSTPGRPLYSVESYDTKITDFDVSDFESQSCRKNIHKVTRKMLYEEFVRELFALKHKSSSETATKDLLRNYVRLSFVACAESNGQPYVVSSHGMERSVSFPDTSREFKDMAKAQESSFGEKLQNMGTSIANFVAGRSVFNTLNDLRKYYQRQPGYSDNVRVFDLQTNFGVYQVSADRMYMEPTRSFLKQRLREIALSSRALEYCQMSSFYPRSNKNQFTERFIGASNAMITALYSKNPFGEWESVDSNGDGRVDRIRVRNSDGTTSVIPDPKKIEKLQSLRNAVWGFADMMAMCPRLNMDLGKITMAEFGSRYYGPLRSSQVSNSKARCADGNELLKKGVSTSQLGTQTCSQAFAELARRVNAGLIDESKLNLKPFADSDIVHNQVIRKPAKNLILPRTSAPAIEALLPTSATFPGEKISPVAAPESEAPGANTPIGEAGEGAAAPEPAPQ